MSFWFYVKNKSGKRSLLSVGIPLMPFVTIIGILSAIVVVNFTHYDRKSEFEKYSRKWKTTPSQKRIHIVNPGLCYQHLKGKNRDEVINFLGEPDRRDEHIFLYDLDRIDGSSYRWTLWVDFDKNGCVTRVFVDD